MNGTHKHEYSKHTGHTEYADHAEHRHLRGGDSFDPCGRSCSDVTEYCDCRYKRAAAQSLLNRECP